MSKGEKFLITADIHAHNHKSYSTPLESGKNSVFMVTVDILRQIRALAETTGIWNIICAGDLFDSKNRVPVVVIDEVFDELVEWSEMGLNLLLIPGNHDLAVRNGDVNVLELFSQLDGIHVISHPQKYEWCIGTSPGGDAKYANVAAVPFREVMDPAWFTTEFEVERPINLCVAHGLVAGADLRPDTFTDAEKISYGNSGKIDYKALQKFNLSIVGHIHYPQILGKKRNVLIPGQPWYQWRHEQIQERGVWEVEILKAKVNYTLHPLKCPHFAQASVNEVGNVIIDKGISGNIVLLRPENELVGEDKLHAVREQFKEEGAFYVELLPAANQASVDSDHVVRVKLAPESTPQGILGTVLCSDFVSLGGFDAEEIEKLGCDLLETVLRRQREGS